MALKIFQKPPKIRPHRNQACHSTYNRKKSRDDNDSAVLLLVESQYSSVHVISSSAGEVRVPLNWGVHMCLRWVWRVGRRALKVRLSVRWLVLVLEVLVKSKALKSLVSEAAFTLLRAWYVEYQKKGKFLFLEKLALISRVRLQVAKPILASKKKRKKAQASSHDWARLAKSNDP